MTYKIIALIIPLTISSIANISGGSIISPKAKPIDLTFVPVDPGVEVPDTDYFDCSTYGPFPLSNVSDFDATFTYALYSVSSQNIIERIRLFNSSNKVVSSTSKSVKSYVAGTRNSVTFTIPLRNYFTNDGLTLKFEILNSSNYSILKTFAVTFYPPSNETVSGVTLKREIYRSRSLGFYGDTVNLNSLVETFDFTCFGDYLNVDNYYKLDVSNNYFLYPNYHSFEYINASLRFNDSECLFPYYTHQKSGDIIIPLTLTKIGNKIKLQYNKTFYIDTRTLQISDIARYKFVTTSDFYLPVNGRTKFNNKTLYFEFSGLGIDGITTTIPVKYNASKSIVGVCNDGEYCVTGGRR